MSEKVIGGWGEHNGEKPVKLFDGANSFGEIIDLVRSAQPGTLKDSQGGRGKRYEYFTNQTALGKCKACARGIYR